MHCRHEFAAPFACLSGSSSHFVRFCGNTGHRQGCVTQAFCRVVWCRSSVLVRVKNLGTVRKADEHIGSSLHLLKVMCGSSHSANVEAVQCRSWRIKKLLRHAAYCSILQHIWSYLSDLAPELMPGSNRTVQHGWRERSDCQWAGWPYLGGCASFFENVIGCQDLPGVSIRFGRMVFLPYPQTSLTCRWSILMIHTGGCSFEVQDGVALETGFEMIWVTVCYSVCYVSFIELPRPG